jgi:ABC-2 type transport system ATP-binding protein
VGADIQSRAALLRLVADLAQRGVGVLYTTHYLHEVEQLDATVAILHRGRIRATGSVDELVSRHGTTGVALRFATAPPPQWPPPDGAVTNGPVVNWATPHPAAAATRALRDLGSAAESVRDIRLLRPSLEDVFLQVTGTDPAALGSNQRDDAGIDPTAT